MTTNAPSTLVGQQRSWRVAEPTDPSPLGALPYVVGHILWRRGVREAEEAREFLAVSDSLLEPLDTLPDVDRAARRLAAARDRGETAAVFGDFDADGVTGTALLCRALRRFGFPPDRVLHYIPHRVAEGHGLNRIAIEQLRGRGAGLIVTVDCGVADIEEIDYARSLGMDTIVTDHHLAAAALPSAAAVINPHAPHSRYGFDHLTGVGMTLKLAQALLQPSFGREWSAGLMELAAIGTITDMAPLLGENRYIVHHGTRQLQRTASPGIRALLEASRVAPLHVNAETIGFSIGPRLNAAGRLDHADVALELLLTEEAARAAEIVAVLNSYNGERQRMTQETVQRAKALVPAAAPPLILVGEADFSPGIVGLAAGKLAEEFGAPAAVYGMEDGRVMASCRSAPNFHWANALDRCADLLLRHGGHAQAAGFACEAAALPELRERLTSIAAEQLDGTAPPREGVIDADIQPGELMGSTFQALRQLEPFGIGNPAPVFLARGVQVLKASPMGADGQHFKLSIRSGGAAWDAVAFRQRWRGGIDRVDLIYTIDVDHWNGQPRVRLKIQDYAPTAQPRLAL